MRVKGKALTGPILGLIGGILLVLGGFLWIYLYINVIEATLNSYGLTYADVSGYNYHLWYLNASLTFLWGGIGILGAVFAMHGKRYAGFLLLAVGFISILGLFVIRIGEPVLVDLGGGYYLQLRPIPLSGCLIIIDPFLVLTGGVLTFLVKGENQNVSKLKI